MPCVFVCFFKSEVKGIELVMSQVGGWVGRWVDDGLCVCLFFWGGEGREMMCAHARALSSIDHLTNEPPFFPPPPRRAARAPRPSRRSRRTTGISST